MNLEKANRAITIAWILALVVGGGNILLTIAYGFGGTLADITLYNWIDFTVTFGFVFGIYKKSRIASGGWPIYYFVTQLIGWLGSGVGGPPVFPIVFLFFFIQGFRGTVTYHQLKDEPVDSVTA